MFSNSKSIIKKNNCGFSLIEIMIVIGLLGGLSAIVINLTKQSSKSSTKYQLDTEVTLITNEINGILSDPNKCLTTFTDATQAASPATPTTPTANVINPRVLLESQVLIESTLLVVDLTVMAEYKLPVIFSI